MKILILFLIPLAFSSCLTTSMVEKAKTDRKPQQVHAIKDAYADTSGNIIVNFTAKLSNAKKDVPVHLVVPVNTLMRIYLGYHSVKGRFSEGEQLLYGVNRITPMTLTVSDSLKYTPEIEYKQERLMEGFYTPGPADTLITHRFRLPVNPEEYKYEVNWKYKKQERILMLYQPSVPYKSTYVPISNIIISAEPSHRKKYSRYWMAALTGPADLVTLPIQGLGIGFAYALSSAMRF